MAVWGWVWVLGVRGRSAVLPAVFVALILCGPVELGVLAVAASEEQGVVGRQPARQEATEGS